MSGKSNDEKRNDIKQDVQEDKDDGLLEKVGKVIDPSGRDVSDAELIDPGSNIPDSIPASTRPTPTNQKPADRK